MHRAEAVIVLTVYSRPGCHLCDEMIADLIQLVEDRARIEVVDISLDEELHSRYFLEIPVLKHGDRELSRYRLDSERVTQVVGRRAS